MNEEASTAAIAPAESTAPKPKRTWRLALELVRQNPGATMLPLLVTQVPSGIALGGLYLYLHLGPYSEAKVNVGGIVSNDAPSGLVLLILIAVAVHSLFSFVGGAAAVVAAHGTLQGKPPRLSESLDPAFTKMGGVLVLGIVFNLLFAATSIGIILLAYFMVRYGLAFHALILDGASPIGALGASWRLLKGRMLAFVGLLLSTLPVIVGVLLVFFVFLTVATAPIGADPGRDAAVILNAVVLASASLFGVPATAYLAAATTIFYLSAKEQSGA